jgi:hypothetical protein
MPVRKRKTKAIKAKGPIQTVKQSVKVVIQAPPVRRRRATTGGKRDMLRGLMRAPEYTTFRDLTPVPKASTQQPLDLNQLRLAFQDAIGSVSGGLNIAPKGLLPPPKEEEKKSDDVFEDITEKVEKLEKEKANRLAGVIKGKETRELTKKALAFAEERQKMRGVEALKMNVMDDVPLSLIFQEEAKKKKADAFRRDRLGRMVFEGLRENVLLSKSGPKEPPPPFVPTQPPPPPPPRKMVTTQQALNKMKSIAKKAN